MAVFTKILTSVDVEEHLELPNDTIREALPPFQGARDIVFPVILGSDGPEVEVQCSSRSGRLAFTKGWRDIARHLRLNAGAALTLHREDHGTVQYKMTVRSAN